MIAPAYIDRQRGSALLMSLGILLMISMIAIMTAQIGAIEHRITGNHYRAKQAVSAGQAGIADAIRYMDRITIGGQGNIINNQQLNMRDNNNNVVTTQTLLSGGNTVSSYSVNYSTINNGVHDQMRVNVTAQSVDTGAVSNVSQALNFQGVVFNQPEAPVIARTTVNLGGSTVTNDGSVAGGVADVAIWSGGNVNGAGATVINVTAGTGLSSNDAPLQALTTNGFYDNFFRFTRADTQARATSLVCSPTCFETDPTVQAVAASGGVLWVTGNLTLGNGGSITMGNAARPVIIVMDGGTFRLDSGSTVNGLVYIAGNWNNANRFGNINGAVLAEGSIAGSNLNITYTAAIVNATRIGAYSPIAGTWKDWP